MLSFQLIVVVYGHCLRIEEEVLMVSLLNTRTLEYISDSLKVYPHTSYRHPVQTCLSIDLCLIDVGFIKELGRWPRLLPRLNTPKQKGGPG